MQEITVYDAYGDSLTNLVQWDKDVSIYVEDSEIDTAYQMHFFNSTMDEALVVSTEYSDGVLKAKIPNILLTQPHAIIGYIKTRELKDVEEKCLYRFRINIIKRPKPSDFVYVESDDYISITYVLQECREYASQSNQSAEEAANSATLSKSYAVGGTSTRPNEDTNNASYYNGQAKTSATNAKSSETKAKSSETNAANSERDAKNSSNLSKSYAVGTNGAVRTGDDTDNAKYYYELTLEIRETLGGAILPKGTITSEQFFALEGSEKVAGYMYNISNGFTTDSTFKEGAGHIYPNGANVYYTADGYWDCFSGTMDGLLQTVNDLQNTVASLENMLFKKEVHIGLCTDDGRSIITSSGESVDAWWKLLTS